MSPPFVALWLLWMVAKCRAVCLPECVRGLCLTLPRTGGVSQVCECGLFYEGVTCESVNLDTPAKEVGPTYISFTWDRTLYAGSIPDLERFVFLVYPRELSDNVKTNYRLQTPLGDLTNAEQITLSGLTSGGIAYVVCLIHNSTDFDNLTDSALMDLTHHDRKSCLSFQTGYDISDPYTKAAVWVTGAMSIILVLIFISGFVEECNRKPVGKRIRRSLRSSWKAIFLERYAESKQRIERAEARHKDQELGNYNSGFESVTQPNNDILHKRDENTTQNQNTTQPNIS